MLHGLLDWQRASWIPLLALDGNAVALDVGSGYGAITHSLSLSVGRLFSVEAMSERIEFTKIRLEQEKISNVHLVQASALDLPFFDGTFDLIVVNGVLEWVGEWERSKGVRTVQVDFLRRLHRLLKDDGVLVLGIENRLSYESLRGAIDHSGLRYTNLMPRFLANVYVRCNRRQHYRSPLDRTEYRTYTYSENGYRKLLSEAGFASQYYWSYPGYNRPLSLVPLANRFIRDEFIFAKPDLSSATRSNWRRRLKSALINLGVLRIVVPDFLIFAIKDSRSSSMPTQRLWRAVQCSLSQELTIEKPQLVFSTEPFGKKNLLHIFDSANDGAKLIVKTSTPRVGSSTAVQREFANLSRVSACLQAQPNIGVAVPSPLSSFHVGNYHYAAESTAAGYPLSRLLYSQPQPLRLSYLRKELPRCVRAAANLAQVLRGTCQAQAVDPLWWELPSGLQAITGPNRLAEELRFVSESDYTDWVQHGDFTADNVFLTSSNRHIAVIDWDHLVRGVPPLYDVVCLLLSLTSVAMIDDRGRYQAERQFLHVFFEDTAFAQIFRNLLLSACEHLGIQPTNVWKMFIQTLLLRVNDHASRGSMPIAQLELRCLELALQRRDDFLLAAITDVAMKPNSA
jgi:SAM-dependent methyltransferase